MLENKENREEFVGQGEPSVEDAFLPLLNLVQKVCDRNLHFFSSIFLNAAPSAMPLCAMPQTIPNLPAMSIATAEVGEQLQTGDSSAAVGEQLQTGNSPVVVLSEIRRLKVVQ